MAADVSSYDAGHAAFSNISIRRAREQAGRGFTIAELLIVVAIVSVLVAVAIPVFMSSLESAKEGTCLANRRSMYGEAVTTAMNGEKTELEVFTELNAKRDELGYTCPDNGTWIWNESARTISCSEHPGEEDNAGIAASKSYLEGWLQFVADYAGGKNNDDMRNDFLKAGNNPKLVFEGGEYDVQPFYQSRSGESWLFAKTGTANSWNASFVYDPIDQSWYRCFTSWGKPGSMSITLFDDTEDLHQYMTGEKTDKYGNTWEKIEDPAITAS
ncbi:prepilin-type N-terminal cleavage/methylation domain-containing protein [Arabiibacter massiliensis]|uniref:prepilin-type N-terminal cleavage/methylation domain-containing protein n=1 Tax=Arabiibacter massiliensis TaxID=1870985 RepID=UPI001E4CC6AE|nr:prepilin-type N-terminal cleavage/methylation domain-containing protein [Arabiibacter massiliensis]